MYPRMLSCGKDDCDVLTFDFDRERARFAAAERTVVRSLRGQLIGAILNEDVVDERSGEVLLIKGKTLEAEDLPVLCNHLVPFVSLWDNNGDEAHDTKIHHTE